MNSSCFQQIEDTDLSEFQQGVETGGKTPTHYRMVHLPKCLQDLLAFLQSNEHAIIWMEETSYFGNEMDFLGDDSQYSCLLLEIDEHNLHLAGHFSRDVAQTAIMLWTLEDRSDQPSIAISDPIRGKPFDLNLFRAGEIDSFLKMNARQNRDTSFWNIKKIPVELSIVLASQEQEIDLTLSDSSFKDGGRAFVKALGERRTCFGNLTLEGTTANVLKDRAKHLLLEVTKLETFAVIYSVEEVAEQEEPELIYSEEEDFVPFDSKAKKVIFDLGGTKWKEPISQLSIATERFVLKVTNDESGYASLFLKASGGLIEMGLLVEESHTLKIQTIYDLMEAIQGNQSLEILELGSIHQSWLPFWKHLMGILAHHQGLGKLTFHLHSDCPREVLDDLLLMVQENRKIVDVDLPGQKNDDIRMHRLKRILEENQRSRATDDCTRSLEYSNFVPEAATTENEEGRERKRSRPYSNELSTESSIHKELAEQKKLIEEFKEEVRDGNTHASKILHYFVARERADNQDSAQKVDQQWVQMKSEMTELKEYIADLIGSQRRANDCDNVYEC